MRRPILLTLCACAVVAVAGVSAGPERPAYAQSPSDEVRDILVRFVAADGTPLEGKLSIPAGVTRPVPVVAYLHGAGARTYDHPVRYRAADGTIQSVDYLGYHARELARLGIGFFRISKRGCKRDAAGQMVVDRDVFSKATPTMLLNDYARGLDILRTQAEIVASQIVIMGSSEGTRLAPQLALQSPGGIVGLVLTSVQSDNQHDTVAWQNTMGPWRAVQSLIPGATENERTRAEYDAAFAKNASLATRLPFVAIDSDKNGAITNTELATLVAPRMDAILKAVADRNDDFLWTQLLNLSSAYLLDGWTGAPTRDFLLKLNVPIGIFHGELDGTTRVEGVREIDAAFKAAKKTNLTVHTYPGLDHDLGWTPERASERGVVAFADAFQAALEMTRRR